MCSFAIFKCGVILFSLLIYLSSWLENFSIYLLPSHNSSHVYDFIVVGGGSAGSVVAGRLVESGYEVMLLEAGGSPPWWLTLGMIDAPIFGPLWQRSEIDWSYITEPQQHSCGAMKQRASVWPRGRILGGSSRLNNMVYLRGHKDDWDKWGVSSSEMLYYFKKSERQLGLCANDSRYHSTEGWMPVEDMPHTTRLAKSVLKAAKELGYAIGDLNTMLSTGFMHMQTTSQNGIRFTADQAFLYSSVGKKLLIKTFCLVDQIIFGSNLEADGVQFYQAGGWHIARARFGVVLSAGAIGSPKILLQSGIGPPQHLSELGIPLRVSLPGVGQNLLDHVSTGGGLVLLNSSLSVSLLNLIHPRSFWQYFFEGSGPLTHGGCEAAGLVYSKGSNITQGPPDIQLLVLPAGPAFDLGGHIRHNMGISDKVWDKYFSDSREISVTILVVLLHPKSKGFVKLRSTDPFQSPVIDPNYLSDSRDVETLVEGIYIVKELLKTNAMLKLGAQLNKRHMPGCEQYQFDTREYWRCYVKMLTHTVYHPAGTCRIGTPDDTGAVVDHSYRVHGTKNLFVVDASVMPTLPSANIHAAVTAVAERAADVLVNASKERKPKKSCKSHYFKIMTTIKRTCDVTVDVNAMNGFNSVIR